MREVEIAKMKKWHNSKSSMNCKLRFLNAFATSFTNEDEKREVAIVNCKKKRA